MARLWRQKRGSYISAQAADESDIGGLACQHKIKVCQRKRRRHRYHDIGEGGGGKLNQRQKAGGLWRLAAAKSAGGMK